MDNSTQPPESRAVLRSELRRRPRSPRILQTALITAAVVATLFVAFSPNSFSGGFSDPFATLLTVEPGDVIFPGTPHPNIKIGIVAGHMGNDSGAVCENGTTEADVNFRIATIVQQRLNALGYETDLLKEKAKLEKAKAKLDKKVKK